MKNIYTFKELNFNTFLISKIIFSLLLLAMFFIIPENLIASNIEKGNKILNPTTADISGWVWEDMNGDGLQNDGVSTGISGVIVNLDGTDNGGLSVNLSTTTDANGDYSFNAIEPGNYEITFNLTGSFNYTAADEGANEDLDSDADEGDGTTGFFTLNDLDILTDIDAGFFLFASIGDYAWEDMDGNGLQGDATPLSGVDVTLEGTTGAGDAVSESTTTGAGGDYIFDEVIPGNYRLLFDNGVDFIPTFQDLGGDAQDSDIDGSGYTAFFDVASDDNLVDWDAGFYQFASIGDYAWEDSNGNGEQDDANGASGIDVYLDGDMGDGTPIVQQSTTTDGTGFYEFTNVVPGTYFVTFSTTPAGYDGITVQDAAADDVDSDANPGDGETITEDIESGEVYADFDCGYFSYVRISDYCWEDMNGNGEQDDGTPLGGVNISAVHTGDGTTYNTTSDGAGLYLFDNLAPGEYAITFSIVGYFVTGQDMGGDDSDSDIGPTWAAAGTVVVGPYESGDIDDSVDAGFWFPVRVGDFTWKDINTDGIQDGGGEIGFAYVDMDFNGNTGWLEFVSVTGTSDANGFYSITNVPPGEYQITFIKPASYTESPYQQGGDPELDSDALISDIFTIESGMDNLSIDAGFFVEPPEDCVDEPANECEAADVLCDIEEIHDFCTVMLPPWDPNIPDPLCPNGGFSHNPSWFSFVAASETVTLIIHASDCSVGGGGTEGLQYGVYTDCTFSESVVCVSNCQDPGDINVTINGMNPGEDYFLFIDGCFGTICTYWIEIVEGGGFYEVTEPTGISCSDEDGDCEYICLGATIDFTADEMDDAADYIWTINGEWYDIYDEQTIAVTFDEEGTYEFCVYGQNPCHLSGTVCTTVIVEAVDDEDLGQFEVCANDLELEGYEPDGWDGGILTTTGIHEFETYSDAGCIFTQMVEIVELPNEEAIVDTLVCAGDVIDYFGFSFESDVEDYPLTLEDGSTNGCDKFVNFNATFMNLDFAQIEGPICLGDLQFQFNVLSVSPHPADITDISVQWFVDGDPVGDAVTTAPYSIVVTDEGYYTFEITLSKNDVSCTYIVDADGIQLYHDDVIPEEVQQSDWTLAYCNNVGDTLAYTVFDANFENDYNWTWPVDVNYFYVDSANATLYIDWTGSQGGEICVQAENSCGVSEWLCQIIEISEGPLASFTAPDSLCLTDLAQISYTGNATGGAEYEWVFSGGVDTSGNNDQGAGPYVMEWTNSGPKVITLVVTENGCISPLETFTIGLEEPLQEPFVSCQSNQSSIIFSWDEVLNSEDYDVELLSGNAGTLVDNTYTVDGLNPLDEVSIIVTAINDQLCPSVASDTIVCYALDCPDITLDITVEDTTLCYTGGGSAFILDHIINPTGLGDVSWDGPGIIDTDTGLFHPDSAGFGSHQIRLSYVVDNCTFNDQAIINIFEQPTADFTLSADSLCNVDDLVINYIGNTPGGNATWSFDFADNITGTNLEQHTANWVSGGWKTISLVVSQNGCISDEIQHQVFIEEALEEINIDCESSVDSIVFTWPDNNQIGAYVISINGTQEDSLDINTWTVDGLSEGDEIHFTLIGINNGICDNTSGTIDCEAKPCPPYEVEITPIPNKICLVNGLPTILLEATLTNAETQGITTWSGNGVDPSTGVFDPLLAGPGTHTIGYRYAEGSCYIETSFEVTLIEQPVTDFVIDQTKICITDKVTITNNAFNPSFNYIWNIEGAIVNVVDDFIQEALWTTPGTYDISLYVTNDICESELISYSVEVEPELVEPVVACDPYTNRIELSWTNVDCASTYQVFVDGALLVETASNSTVIDNLDPSQEVDIQIIAVSECECPSVAISLQCETLDCASVELSIDGLPYSACQDEVSSTLTLDASVVGATGGNIQWGGTNIDANSGVVQLNQLAPGDHTFTLFYDLDNCSYEISDIATIFPSASFDVNTLDPYCNNDTNGSLEIISNTGTAPFNYIVNGTPQTETLIEQLGAGSFSIQLTDDNGCTASTQVTLTNPPEILPEIIGADVIQENQNSTYSLIFGSQPSDAQYLWYFENGDTISTEATAVIAINELVNLCVDVTFNNGQCTESTCVPVRFEEVVDIWIPNVFSPNNDDDNDKFYILADNSVESITSMRIYDRWGELVFENLEFEANNPDEGWNGQKGDVKLLPGVYVYDIVVRTVEEKTIRKTGDITLLR